MNQPHPIRVMDFRGTYKGGGGPDKTILNSAAQHDKKRVDILVAYLRDPEDRDYQIDTWAQSLGINYIDVPDRKLLDWNCISSLKRIITAKNIQLLHAHDDKTSLYGWLLKLMIPQLHIMFTCHLHSPYTRAEFSSNLAYLRFKIRRKIQIFLMNRYQKPILAVSHDTKRCITKDGVNVNDIETLHNGIDIDAWKAELGTPVLRKEFNIKEDEFLIGTVARIAQKHKDLPTFYKVAAEIRKSIPQVKFVIVGDGHGDELTKAKNTVERLGLSDSLFFTGHRSDLLDIYASLDLFLMTSLTEGLPNTILEAMAMGVPVVSTAVAGVPEVVEHNTTGYLSPIGDVQGLSRQVIKLLRDRDLIKRFQQTSRERIEKEFSFAHRVKKMEDYYEHFIAE